MIDSSFAEQLIVWQLHYGRHNLPWQVKDPYRRWISEIMLQQTQVSVVVGYYNRFMARFPSLQSLYQGSEEEVLQLWSGLGYYTRARNIWRCSQKIKQDFNGQFPDSVAKLITLPGIGLSTAGAIASAAFDIPAPIMDGNVKRVFARIEAISEPIDKASTEKLLWQMAHSLVPQENTSVYNQALMDLGATVCTKTQPKCNACPVSFLCKAHQEGKEVSYPVRTRAKIKPVRTVKMTLFYSGSSVWLEKRTSKGVWQGLWSLPENSPIKGEIFSSFTHTFSHYRLEASVEMIQCSEKENPTPNGKWIPLSDIPAEALPAPVKKLILSNFRPQ